MAFSEIANSVTQTIGKNLTTPETINRLQGSLNQYIVRPLNAFGLAGFIFDVDGDATHTLQAEITDHYTEANSAIQDHIAIKPLKVVLKNYVGELVYSKQSKVLNQLQAVARKLTVIDSFIPKLTSAALQAKELLSSDLSFNNLSAVSTSKTADIWGLIKNLTPPTTRQEQAYLFFKALFEQKMLVSVQTPFEFITNMAIESIVAHQGEESKYISDFSITLKKINTVSVRTEKITAQEAAKVPQAPSPSEKPENHQTRTGLQREVVSNSGATQGKGQIDQVEVILNKSDWPEPTP